MINTFYFSFFLCTIDVAFEKDIVLCEVPFGGVLFINNLVPHRRLVFFLFVQSPFSFLWTLGVSCFQYSETPFEQLLLTVVRLPKLGTRTTSSPRKGNPKIFRLSYSNEGRVWTLLLLTSVSVPEHWQPRTQWLSPQFLEHWSCPATYHSLQ